MKTLYLCSILNNNSNSEYDVKVGKHCTRDFNERIKLIYIENTIKRTKEKLCTSMCIMISNEISDKAVFFLAKF